MTDKWFCLDEKTYESYCKCKVQMDNTVNEDLNIIRECSSLNVNNIKEKMMFDLFYQAMIFSKDNKFNYNDAKYLTTTIERELQYLIQTHSEESYHSSAYERFLNYVSIQLYMHKITSLLIFVIT